MDDIVGILVIVILILLTAFFVAAEFAIVKVRSTRIEQMVQEGNKRAEAAKKIIDHLDGYLSATQLGITITALGIGWVGEPAVSHLFEPLFHVLGLGGTATKSISAIISFVVITFINVVLGELAPKTLAIQKAESITLAISYPLIWFNRIMFPFIWLLNGSARIVSRLFGGKQVTEQDSAHSEEELRLILSESYRSGEINQSELNYMNRIFDFNERTSREIMVPRTEIACLYKDDPIEENLAVLKKEKYTRFPVADEDKDNIIGMINIKDIFDDLLTKDVKSLEGYIRPIITVFETTPIQELLIKMQKEGIHMAILSDEYGGTAGLVTAEDIIEEIVGDIRDEFDANEEPEIQRLSQDTLLIDSKVLITEVNELLNIDIEDDDLDTIGGWVLSEESDVKQGTTVVYDNYKFEVKEIDDRHIKKLLVKKRDDHTEQPVENRQRLTENSTI
ncbi:CBS domain containing-hemolysin-like protein [Pullulanibacillus pueri]|uniref:Membrane protein n=1 Tax=Pullulanibacillus pueri TaxID=1437324 RepID=A0A8J3EKW0_9BACL|nr:hemolysin family protein [Pullulanibacillus pueri]MBM7681374.1 CBS domain containing-hemolysin-like protein [Pullulanibacillus pueri]GGH78626.1 membrane protein [Pullulanibacillus pueri]